MKKIFLLLFVFSFLSATLSAQDTFSIVAVDTVTGEIGSAGASCIDETQISGGAIIISDVIPGRGAIHTQSYWNATNQQNAHARMEEGMDPQEIIDWLVSHDAQGNPGVRQYGIVDFDSLGQARSAGFTGANCMNYKNHITGPNYAIQGNILLGQQILDSMEARFLREDGTLAEKLMAALQGAKVPGADTRCTENGTSSLSAFIRVAHPWDTEGNFYCDINVPSLPEGMEPIDSLQILFDQWLQLTVEVPEVSPSAPPLLIFPNPARNTIRIRTGEGISDALHDNRPAEEALFDIYDLCGRIMGSYRISLDTFLRGSLEVDITAYPPGLYVVRLKSEAVFQSPVKFVKVP